MHREFRRIGRISRGKQDRLGLDYQNAEDVHDVTNMHYRSKDASGSSYTRGNERGHGCRRQEPSYVHVERTCYFHRGVTWTELKDHRGIICPARSVNVWNNFTNEPCRKGPISF